MITFRPGVLGAVGVLLATAGCGTTPKGTELDVSAQLVLCRGDSCVAVAASGATVSVMQGDRIVRTGQADDAGSFRVTGLPPGSYVARVTAPELGVAGTSAPMEVEPGGASDLTIRLQPALATTFVPS